MKKLLLALALLLLPSAASAQCTGIFQPNTLCGNNSVKAQPPFSISASGIITGPGSSTVGDLALWNNLTGSALKDQAPAALTGVNDTNVTITTGGAAATSLVNAASLTLGWTGTLAAARLNANVVQGITNDTNVTGSITAQNLTLGWTGTLAAGRLNSNVVQAFTNDTNITASITAQNATLAWAGQLAISRGGTGASTQAGAAIAVLPVPVNTGDIVYWNGTIWTTLPGNNSGTQLLQENSSGLPSWVTVAGTGTITSILGQGGIAVLASSNPITSSGTIALDGNYTGFALSNCTLTASVGSSLLTVALKDNAGNDPSATSPCNINYRSATANTGGTTLVQQTTAISISTFATGATLGTSNNTAFRFWVVAFNNAATNVLALFNASTSTQIFPLDEYRVASSTPISGSATSAGVFYTPNGTTISNKAFRILGFIEYNSTGLATAGTSASAPNFVQAFGPGIHRPGEVVQEKYLLTETQTGNATNTKTPTAATITITPTSAANPLRAMSVGSAFSNSSGLVIILQIYSASGANAVGTGIHYVVVGSGNFVSGQTLRAWDLPNTASAIDYTVYLNTNAGGGTAYYPFSGGGTVDMSVTEIMG